MDANTVTTMPIISRSKKKNVLRSKFRNGPLRREDFVTDDFDDFFFDFAINHYHHEFVRPNQVGVASYHSIDFP